MKTHPTLVRRSGLASTALLALGGALALFAAGCSKQEPPSVRAASALSDAKIAVAGARPQFPSDAFPETGGFLEEVAWDAEAKTVHLKGWAPLDPRADSTRFVLRDPFDQLRGAGRPTFVPRDRPDVAAAHPDQPVLLHAGFAASVRVENAPKGDHWADTLELYCLGPTDVLYRLSPAGDPGRRSWDRARDHFEVALIYVAPELAVPAKTKGSLDVCAPGPAAGSVHLTGWAPFDGSSRQSVLIVQLAPSLSPASIMSAGSVARPDVRAAVDPQREELDRSGFDLLLQLPGGLDSLRSRGALRLWAIDARGQAVEVGLPALRHL